MQKNTAIVLHRYCTFISQTLFGCSELLLCRSLPPANEVWGKVIFLHLSVILFTGGCLVPGGACSGGACSRGVVPALGGACSGGCVPGGDPPDGYCCGQYASYCRVATAQGKQGIWFLLFPDREFCFDTGKILRHRENIFLWHREKFRHRENIWLWLLKWKVCLFFKFQKFFSLASLGISLHLKSIIYFCFHMLYLLFYLCICSLVDYIYAWYLFQTRKDAYV